jgi:hypothetical protein
MPANPWALTKSQLQYDFVRLLAARNYITGLELPMKDISPQILDIYGQVWSLTSADWF